MDEVVVTALGVARKKKALGYAVQDVKNEEIVRTGNSDLSGAIQGKLTGIDFKPSSGMPGASSQVVIRGARSFTGNNTPLYIVDGMPIASTLIFSQEPEVISRLKEMALQDQTFQTAQWILIRLILKVSTYLKIRQQRLFMAVMCRFAYGSDDVTTNSNVREAYGDGTYVYTENVWWAGGTR